MYYIDNGWDVVDYIHRNSPHHTMDMAYRVSIWFDWLIPFEGGRRGDAVDRVRAVVGARPQAEPGEGDVTTQSDLKEGVPISWALLAPQLKSLFTTPRHQLGVHGEYMVWLSDRDEERVMDRARVVGGARPQVELGWRLTAAAGRVVRGDRPHYRATVKLPS